MMAGSINGGTPESETYILPDLGWSVLLDVIARDARPGACIEVHTAPMKALVEEKLREIERTDVTIRFKPRQDSAAKERKA